MPSGFKSDRRLFLSGDKSRVVEAADKSAAWLFASKGSVIPSAEAEAYSLECRDGKVILPAAPAAEPKAAKKGEDKARQRGGDKAVNPRPPDREKH